MEHMIELNGKNYALRYTVNSMCAVEQRAGRPLDCLLKYDYTAARLLLWGGLIDGCPELTLQEAGALMDACLRGGGTLEALIAACAEAMREASFFGPAAEETEAALSATPGSP